MNESLSKLKCKSCSGKTHKFTNEEIEFNLNKISDWSVNEQKEMIFKKVSFKNFLDSLKFVNLVSKVSEEEGHHPDISFGWGYCLIMLHTHAIKGLSLNDFILASKIDNLLKNR